MRRDVTSERLTDRRTFIKIGVAGGATFTVSGVLAACGGGEAGGPAQRGTPASGTEAPPAPSAPTGVLRSAWDPVEDSLDPAVSPGGSAFLWRNVYGGLLAYGADGRLSPWLATSYRSNETATEWEFKLREGVRFHDGSELDSTVVKQSFQHYVDVVSPWAPPKGIELHDADPGVLRITSKTPVPDIARSSPVIQIISPKVLSRGKDAVVRDPVGTGPFRFSRYRANQGALLEAFDEFWGKGPYFEAVECSFIKEPAARIAALRSGGVDLVYKVGPEQLAQLEDSQFRVETNDLWTGTYLVLLTYNEPVTSREIRQAIAHAIDREALIDKIALGQASKLDSWFPKGIYGAVVPDVTYDYDPDRARELIAASGLPADELKISILGSAPLSTRQVLLSEAVAQMLSDVGFEATVDVADIGAAADRLYAQTAPWQVVPGDAGWLNGGPTFVATGYLPTVAGYDPPEYQKLAERALSTADGPARERALADIQELVARDVPMFPLYQPRVSTAMKADVHGFTNPADAFMVYLGDTYRAG